MPEAIFSVPTQNSVQKQLDSTLAAGATSVVLSEDVSALFTGTDATHPCVCVIDRVDANGNLTPTKREYIKFTGVSTTTLTGCTRNADSSGSDQEHAVGAIVEFVPDVLWAKSLQDNYADLTTTQTFTGEKTFGDGLLKATSPKITTGINDSGGNELIKVTATASAVNEITLANGAAGGNPTISGSGGDDNVGIDFKTKGTGVVRIPSSVVVQVLPGNASLSTGDGKVYITIPEELSGMNLASVYAKVITAAATGATTLTQMQIRNVTDSVDMLTTPISIDVTETGSDTAATPAVIDATKDDVTLNDILALDIDAVTESAPKGLLIKLGFKLP